MKEVFLSDNKGFRVPPGVVAAHPVLGSGIILTDASVGADHTQAVSAGTTYAVTLLSAATTLGMKLGLAAVTTDANVIWVCVPYETILVRIPEGYTSLHYEGLGDGASVLLRKVAGV